MLLIAFRNKHGVSLIEVLIALVVALLIFFALMQTALVGIDANMRNLLRDEAVNVADVRMNEARNVLFTNVVNDTGSLTSGACAGSCPTGFAATGTCEQRNMRNIADFKYCTNVTCDDDDHNCSTDESSVKRVTVRIGWKWKSDDYNHVISTLRKR